MSQDRQDSTPARLVGVYNANGGLLGELTYVVNKIRGATHCGLCDISHGKSTRPRKDWTKAIKQLPVPLETVHLNEMDADTERAADGTSPVIVYLDGKTDQILLGPEDLDSCGGRVDVFTDLILSRLPDSAG
ncbi:MULTISPECIES: hypothetical protein [unclassified Corynebacterium]|uniref:hypothetical protein n=1 Tax=unclassified Corynebacterium TaxID=2624378 RepID=UPI0035249644